VDRKISDHDVINIDIVKWPPKVFGIEMRQSLYCVYTLSKLVESMPGIKRIIEFGTGSGVMTLLIGLLSHDKCVPLYTYDIAPIESDAVHSALRSLNNVYVMRDDVFASEESISKLISDGGRALVLCDNGNKIKEFEMYSKYLKPGDVICVHDYFRSAAESNDGTETWVCCEITYNDIETYCKKYNLTPYMDDLMRPSHWGCFIKE
jgi:tRNA A58 N-methylase Trm61